MGIVCHLKIQTRDCQHGNTGPEEFPASEEKRINIKECGKSGLNITT